MAEALEKGAGNPQRSIPRDGASQQGYQCINCSSVCVPLKPRERTADRARGTVKLDNTPCPLCDCLEFKRIQVFVEIKF